MTKEDLYKKAQYALDILREESVTLVANLPAEAYVLFGGERAYDAAVTDFASQQNFALRMLIEAAIDLRRMGCVYS